MILDLWLLDETIVIGLEIMIEGRRGKIRDIHPVDLFYGFYGWGGSNVKKCGCLEMAVTWNEDNRIGERIAGAKHWRRGSKDYTFLTQCKHHKHGQWSRKMDKPVRIIDKMMGK